MATTNKPTGYVLWQGPSMLDGAPIVAIAITSSGNRKTGNMLQTYILRADVKPTEALRTGQDASICGDCKHRPINGGACYVVVAQGPTVVYKTWQAGKYPHIAQTAESDREGMANLGRDRMVRLGTYGDPAAVPVWVWQALTRNAQGRTGYTHQWATKAGRQGAGALRLLVMASVDNAAELAAARADGWRTFRVRGDAEPIAEREFTCPASEEAGKRTTCADCGACDGAQRGAGKASPVIVVHGAKARRFVPIVPASAIVATA
jgi:hypothetical protein